MRRIIYGMFVSVDGYIAGPRGEIDWHVIDEELHRFANERQAAIDTHLYGRRMWEVMEYWSTADADPRLADYARAFARDWQAARHIVYSRTLERAPKNATLEREIDPEAIAQLKAQPGKDIEVGGATLAAAFSALGLVDEYWMYVHPVTLGGGTPMFPAPADRSRLRLIETRAFRSGVVLLRYERERER